MRLKGGGGVQIMDTGNAGLWEVDPNQHSDGLGLKYWPSLAGWKMSSGPLCPPNYSNYQQPKWLKKIWVSQSSILSVEMVPVLQPSGPRVDKILQGHFKIQGHAAELPLFP